MTQNQAVSEDGSASHSGSPAPSLYSFSSSVDGQVMFRNVYGRVLNNQNETYFLPADNEEHRRLDLQHRILTLTLGRLYPAAEHVWKALRPRTDRRPAMMDVGTGSASWAIEMAIEFPYCDVVGIDLVPPRLNSGEIPRNCRFEIDDANLGFSHYRNSFDVVHVRSVSSGIRDFPSLLRDLAQVLHPEGVLLLGDGDMQLYDEDQAPISLSEPGTPGFSWTNKVFFSAYNAMKAKGGDVDSPSMNPTWLRSIDSLTQVGWKRVFIPIGPWHYRDEREKIISEMLRTDCLAFISGMEPLLMSEGYLPERVQTMLQEAATELRELRVHLYSRWSFAWAVRAV